MVVNMLRYLLQTSPRQSQGARASIHTHSWAHTHTEALHVALCPLSLFGANEGIANLQYMQPPNKCRPMRCRRHGRHHHQNRQRILCMHTPAP